MIGGYGPIADTVVIVTGPTDGLLLLNPIIVIIHLGCNATTSQNIQLHGNGQVFMALIIMRSNGATLEGHGMIFQEGHFTAHGAM
jgi:hypothetical protein